jgi:hypothetical protein
MIPSILHVIAANHSGSFKIHRFSSQGLTPVRLSLFKEGIHCFKLFRTAKELHGDKIREVRFIMGHILDFIVEAGFDDP